MVVAHLLAAEPAQRHRAEELLRRARHDREHARAALDQEPGHLGGLVRGDAAGDGERDGRPRVGGGVASGRRSGGLGARRGR